MSFNKGSLLHRLDTSSEIANYDIIYNAYSIGDKINLSYNTDGWCKGCIIEHKLDLGSRTDGLTKAKIELARYNETLAKNGEYKAYYLIALSQKNGICYVYKHDDLNNQVDMFNAYDEPDKFLLYVNAERVVKYDVDIVNVVALSERFYETHPRKLLKDFFDYIRSENDKVNIWNGKEEEFAFIMDELTDPVSQKALGRFYTPEKYTSISKKYVLDAIEDVKNKYDDYIILDRCAGTGNLEICFDDDEIITHMVLNTIEWKEYIALLQRFSKFNNKPRVILPPAGVSYEDIFKNPLEIQELMKEYVVFNTEIKDTGTLFAGTLKGGDALTKSFMDSFLPILERHNDKKLGIIILENPPYKDTGDTHNISNVRGNTKSWVKTQAIAMGFDGNSLNELTNQFIWSAMYLFNPDHFIIYAPIKCWKSNHLYERIINGKLSEPTFINGYLCNRKYFHAGETSTSLIHWSFCDFTKSYKLLQFNSDIGEIAVNKAYCPISNLYPKQKRAQQGEHSLGAFSFKWSFLVNSIRCFFTDDTTKNDVLERGVEITKENFSTIIPLFAANNPDVLENYTDKEVLMCTADGGKNYLNDNDFINDCNFYMLLSQKNHCSKDCAIYEYGFSILRKLEKHKEILDLWESIFSKTSTYGIKNIIDDEDNYNIVIDVRGKPRKYWKDAVLGDNISSIKKLIEEFYNLNIKEKMFRYQLIK